MTEFKYNIESLVFPNGAQLYVLKLPDSPSVALQLAVATGSVFEEEYTGCGLSHFLEHMLFQGTENYPGVEVSDAVNRLGGDNNAFTGYYQTVYHMTLPAVHCRKGLDILGDMAVCPTFPAEKFASEKQVICHERAMRADKPNNLLIEKLFSTVFQRHPARYPIIGYLDRIEQVTRDMMVDYFRRRYRPHLCAFVVVGPFSGKQVYAMLEKKLEHWERGMLYQPALPVEPEQSGFREAAGYFNDPLSRVAVGLRIPPAGNADVPVLEVLSGIIGENSSSYLTRELHRKSELAVDVNSAIYPMGGDGVMFFSAVNTPRNHRKCCDKIFEVLASIRKNGVTAAELEREKNQQIAMTLREMRTADDLAMQISGSLGRYFQAVSPEERLNAYTRITLDDVNAAAWRYLDSDRFCKVEMLSDRAPAPRRAAPLPPNGRIESGIAGKLRTVSVSRPRVPLMEAAVITPGGVSFEDASTNGASRLISELVLTSTEDFSEDALSEFMDDYAIECSAVCGFASNLYTFSAPTRFAPQLFRVMKSVFCRPRWNKRVFEREKANLIESIGSSALNPLQRALDASRRLLYGDHPCGLPKAGSVESVRGLTLEAALGFYRRMFDPSRVVFGIGGCFDAKAAADFAAEFSASIPWPENPLVLPPAPRFDSALRSQSIPLPRCQCAVACALPGCDNLGDDRFAFDLLQFSENGLGAQLFKRVREDNSLAYSTGMFANRGFFPGCCSFYAMTSPERRDEVLSLLKAESRRLGTEGMSAEEFTSSMRAAELECAEQMQEPEGALRNAVLAAFYQQEPLELEAQLSQYRRLTLEAVNAILSKYFGAEPAVSVFAGSDEKQ